MRYIETVTDTPHMAKPVRHPDKQQLTVWLHKDVRAALVELARLSGMSIPECLTALIRDAQKKAGI